MVTNESGEANALEVALWERLEYLRVQFETPPTSRAAQLRRRSLPNRIRFVERLLARHRDAPTTARELLLDLERLAEGSPRDTLPLPVGPEMPEVLHEAAELALFLRKSSGLGLADRS